MESVLSKSQLLELKKLYIKNKTVSLDELKKDFPLIFHSLEDANGVSDYRVICCDTLSIWLLRATQLINHDHSVSDEFSLIFSEQTSTFIFEYVIDFWNESGAPLGNSLKELFLKMISFLNVIGDYGKLYHVWLVHVLNNIPFTLRVLYFMVEVLANQVPSSSTFILTTYSSFIKTSISYMWSNALANPVGKALQVIFKNLYNEVEKDDSIWLDSWDNLIIDNMKKDNLRKNIQNYLLPYLFKVSTAAFKMFVKKLVASNKEDELSIMLISLRIGHELAIVEDIFEGEDKIISIDLLASLMGSYKGFFRIESFSLLTLSPRGSKPVPSVVLELVLEKLNVFLTEVDLEIRNEFVSLFKKFILRLRDSTYAINRNSLKMIAKNKFIDEANEGLAKVETNKQFLTRLIAILSDNMKPGSSFQRCNLSLKLLAILVRSGLDDTVDKKFYEKLHMDYPFNIEIYRNHKIVRLLVDNITNDFEEVRELSIEILSMSTLSINELVTEHELSLIVKRSFIMLGDLKGRKADAGSKVLQFVFTNKDEHTNSDNTILDEIVNSLILSVNIAQSNLTVAIYGHNIHGYYLALDSILRKMKVESSEYYCSILQKVIASIFDVWKLIRPVLTHDSPEGNLPKELQEALEPSKKHLETKFGPATQVLLSYSWRAVKESSALLATLLSNFGDDILFKDSKFSLNDIGELLIEQLSTIRHPGAFSSVYPAFLSCCNRCFRLKHEDLPEYWLQKNILLIEDKSHSITRRSGGLPFLITAILTAEYNSVKKKQKKNQIPRLFEITYERLYDIGSRPFTDSNGEETLELPQVHALNSIKSLFIESQLSDLANFYVDRSLDLALSKFSSKHWSMRNASVMLFTALQNRLFGTKKIDNNHLSTISARLFFSRYKKLQPVLLNNFESALKDEKEVENLFPILTILSRLHSTPGYNPVLEFKPLLLKSLESKYWKVREMAARALPSIVNDDSFYSQIQELISLINYADNNQVHGLLIAIKELFVRIHTRTGHENKVIPDQVLNSIFKLAAEVFQSTYLAGITYVEILDLIFERSYGHKGIPQNLLNILGNCFVENNKLTTLDGAKQLFLSRLLTVLLKSYASDKDFENLNDLIKLGLYSELYECQLSCIKFISENITLFNEKEIFAIIDILWLILQSNIWTHVKASSLILLKDLLVASNYQDVELVEKINILFQFVTDPSEDVKSTALECLGPFVVKINTAAIFDKWLALVKSYSGDDNSYHLRFAALKSCISYIQVSSFSTDKSFIKSLVTLYQFLYDDDDEIRETASNFISKNLVKSKFKLVAVESEKLFTEYIRSNYDTEIVHEVVFDIYQKKLSLLDIDIVDELSLFNVEKSNFYRNIVEEFQSYARMLSPITEKQRQVLQKIIDIHSIKVNELLEMEDDILGPLANEDYFNFVYLILFIIKRFNLRNDFTNILANKKDIHNCIID